MRLPRSFGLALSASAAIAMLGGCSSGSSLAPATGANGGGSTTQSLDGHQVGRAISAEMPGARLWKLGQPRPSWMKFQARAGKRGFAYVADISGAGGAVDEFHENNKQSPNPTPLCSVSYPSGTVNDIGVDFSGNLWIPVGVNGATGFVQENRRKCGKVVGTALTGGHGQPAAVAFDSKHAFEYVENIESVYGYNGESGYGNIDVYPAGSTTPSNNLTDNNAGEAIGEAVDAAGDVFMAYLNTARTAGTVAEFVGGQNPAVELSNISTMFPNGVTIDRAQNILVNDYKAGSISVYAPPYTGSAIGTFAVHPSWFCKFDAKGDRLYCGDPVNSTVDVYTYKVKNPGATTYNYSWAVQNGGGLDSTSPDKPAAD